jgi:hypothetical protein
MWVAPPEARLPREVLWFKDLGFDCGVLRGMALTKRVKRDSRLGVMSGRLTDDADELLGVSMKLLVIECSDETMVLTESRSCWFLISRFTPSRRESSSRISAWMLAHFLFISDCRPRISPLTVRRSSTPRSMIASTLSIAVP